MILIFLFLLSINLFCQDVQNVFYCDISHSKISAEVSYDSSRNVYIYNYCIYAGAENTGWIVGFSIDISTKNKQVQKIDMSLNDNCTHRNYQDYADYVSDYAIPVGISCPAPKEICSSDPIYDRSYPGKEVDIGGRAGCSGLNNAQTLKPGESECGYVIEAKYPPGMREYILGPYKKRCYGHIPMDLEHWDALIDENGEIEFYTYPKGYGKDEDWYLYGKTIGPIDPADYQFYNGGGQKPDDVNLFLKYANPLERETKLPKGENTFDLIIYYGETIIPATFKAELNGVDITSRFNPVPKVAEVEKLQLQPGRNTLVLSVDGKNQKGQVATDTDRLVFIVQ